MQKLIRPHQILFVGYDAIIILVNFMENLVDQLVRHYGDVEEAE